jgi:hypothetical protein
MFRKEWLATSMAKDCRTCIHLFGKIPAELYGWRPTEGQRSVEELLRYLSVSTISALKGFKEPEQGWRDRYQAQAKEMPVSEFPAFMERQAQEIEAYFEALTEADLEKEIRMPWGETMLLGYAILFAAAKWLPAYRMQLFLYLKQNGIALTTPNLWHGRDPAA